MSQPTMTNAPLRPEFSAQRLEYVLQPNGWYLLINGPAVLPDELKVEPTRQTKQIHAPLICHSRQRNRQFAFFTGLLPVEGWYIGNQPAVNAKGEKTRRLILFRLSDENRRLTVLYTSRFYRNTANVIDYAQSLLSQLG